MFIYPNPVFTTVTILFDPVLNDAELTIYDLFGQKVKEISHFSGSALTFDRGSLVGSIYFVQITQGNKVIATGKLVITDQY